MGQTYSTQNSNMKYVRECGLKKRVECVRNEQERAGNVEPSKCQYYFWENKMEDCGSTYGGKQKYLQLFAWKVSREEKAGKA